jgi:hypothetical protein
MSGLGMVVLAGVILPELRALVRHIGLMAHIWTDRLVPRDSLAATPTASAIRAPVRSGSSRGYEGDRDSRTAIPPGKPATCRGPCFTAVAGNRGEIVIRRRYARGSAQRKGQYGAKAPDQFRLEGWTFTSASRAGGTSRARSTRPARVPVADLLRPRYASFWSGVVSRSVRTAKSAPTNCSPCSVPSYLDRSSLIPTSRRTCPPGAWK